MNEYYKGNGFGIKTKSGKYYISWPVGVIGNIVEFEISEENAEKAKKSSNDAYEVMIFAETGHWPPTEDERKEISRNFIKKSPDRIIRIPRNQQYFSEEEIKELLPKVNRSKLDKKQNKYYDTLLEKYQLK